MTFRAFSKIRSLRLATAVVTGVIAAGVSANTARAEVSDPWVTTDRTVDCSSYQSIIKDVIKPGMTEEQKALALYSFYRQRVYHYLNMPESRDPLLCINVLGNTLCGSQATCMKGLLEAAGIKVRIRSYPGHTFYEAFYDGKWHGYDTFTNFYVYTRGPNRNVASFEEIKADPTLISDAVKEGRACPEMCPCGDNPMDFVGTNSTDSYEPLKLNWDVKKNTVRKGEEFIRSWWPAGRPLPQTFIAKIGPGPMHGCGTRDRHAEPELYEFWEPYGIPHMGPRVTVSYRHYCNGLINYAPNLTNDDYKDGLISENNIKPSATGLTTSAGDSGELIIPVTCSFYISAGQCIFQATCANQGDSVLLAVSTDGKSWTDVAHADTAGNADRQVCVADLNKVVVHPQIGLHAYQIRFTLKGKAVLNHYLLQTFFVHNAMAAPNLMPGKNQITVAYGGAGAGDHLQLIYRYKDAPDWNGELKTVSKDIASSPLTFEADLPDSKKQPQMQDMTLRNGTLAWQSDKAWSAPAPGDLPQAAPAPAKTASLLVPAKK